MYVLEIKTNIVLDSITVTGIETLPNIAFIIL